MPSPTRFKEKTCPQCGAKHQPGTSAQWCAECRAKGYPSIARSNRARTVGIQLTCVVCDASFRAKHPGKLYCSRACQWRVLKQKVVANVTCAGCGRRFAMTQGRYRSGRGYPKQPSCSTECKATISSLRLTADYAAGASATCPTPAGGIASQPPPSQRQDPGHARHATGVPEPKSDTDAG